MALAVSTVLVLAVPGIALAATASVEAGQLRYTAGADEDNNVRAATGSGIVSLRNEGATITQGAGCRATTPSR